MYTTRVTHVEHTFVTDLNVVSTDKTLQHTAQTLQHTATHCNTLQHTATHSNTLQHTATHLNVVATPHDKGDDVIWIRGLVSTVSEWICVSVLRRECIATWV